MSDHYYPQYPGSAGTQVLPPPHPTAPPVEHGYATGNQPPGFPPFAGAADAHTGPPRPKSGLGSVSPWLRVTFAVLVAVVGALGAYAVVAHGNVGDARTEAAGLSATLEETTASLSAKQAELEQTKQDLEVANQTSSAAMSVLDTAVTCGSLLDEAISAAFNGQPDRFEQLYTEARKACDEMYEAVGQ